MTFGVNILRIIPRLEHIEYFDYLPNTFCRHSQGKRVHYISQIIIIFCKIDTFYILWYKKIFVLNTPLNTVIYLNCNLVLSNIYKEIFLFATNDSIYFITIHYNTWQ